MKLGILKIAIFILIILFIVAGNSCRNRFEEPVLTNDSTIIYQSKTPEDINVKISFCRKVDRKTGEFEGAGTEFTVMEKGRVQAVVDIENRFNTAYDELMFHIDWVDLNDKSIYLKRVVLPVGDSTVRLKTAITISPETREPGEYKLKVYYFRELIAEKSFELLPALQADKIQDLGFTNEITFFTKLDKKTKKRKGIDTVFFLGEKSKVRAGYDLPDLTSLGSRELLFNFKWIGPDDSLFYKKTVDLLAANAKDAISSSISITPEKRDTGNYVSQLYLYDELIAEKKFRVTLKPELPPIELKTNIILYRKLDKKTGKRVDEGTVFTIKNKRKVRAFISIPNRKNYLDRELELQIKWVDSKGKSIYSKKYTIAADDPTSVIKSSISISPDKRKTGKYSLRIYLLDELISEKKFELR